MVILVIAMATTMMTVIVLNMKGEEPGVNATEFELELAERMTEDVLTDIVLGFSLAGSLIVGVTTYVAPGKRWLQMRGAALALESEVSTYSTELRLICASSLPSSQRSVAVGGSRYGSSALELDVMHFLTQAIRKTIHLKWFCW